MTPFRTTKAKGMGLGLVATKIVEAHNGELRVESAIDVGTRFYFSLPIKMDLNVNTLTSNQ